MDRRNMLTAATTSVIAGCLPQITVLENLTKQSKLIDTRLSGKIYINDLLDGEYGFVANAHILTSSLDGILYFGFEHGCNSVRNLKNAYEQVKIIRHADVFYIELPDWMTYEKLKDFKPGRLAGDCSFNKYPDKPAYLAFAKAYPLNASPISNLYIIPSTWEECKTNPLVKRNIDELNKWQAIAQDMCDTCGFQVFPKMNA